MSPVMAILMVEFLCIDIDIDDDDDATRRLEKRSTIYTHEHFGCSYLMFLFFSLPETLCKCRIVIICV